MSDRPDEIWARTTYGYGNEASGTWVGGGKTVPTLILDESCLYLRADLHAQRAKDLERRLDAFITTRGYDPEDDWRKIRSDLIAFLRTLADTEDKT